MSRTSLLKHCIDYRGVDVVQVRFILRTKQLLIDNGVSTTLVNWLYSSGIDTEAYRGYLLNVARSYAKRYSRLNPSRLDHAETRTAEHSLTRGETARHYEDRR